MVLTILKNGLLKLEYKGNCLYSGVKTIKIAKQNYDLNVLEYMIRKLHEEAK